MHVLRQTAAPFRPSRRSLQLRLALLYSGVVFVTGVVLMAIPNFLLASASSTVQPGSQASSGSPVITPGHGPIAHNLLVGSVITLVILAPLSLLLGWLIAGRFLQPLRAMTATAHALSARNLSSRLELEGVDEFGQLGRTLDDLFARLEASFESQRHFVANASHELRTPLAGQRTLIQVALADPDATTATLRSACEEALDLGSQQEHLIASLLLLATSERGVEQWKPLDLAAVVSNVLQSRGQITESQGVTVRPTLNAAPTIGDPNLVESLVANLVENALRYNRLDGWVEISTTTRANLAVIAVSNSGPVIPRDQLDRLFAPFQRLNHDRVHQADGHGLGLAIVRAIADAHGATITAQPRSGGGLDIAVSFPAQPGSS